MAGRWAEGGEMGGDAEQEQREIQMYRRSSILWGIEEKSQFPRHSEGASSPALGPTIAS